MHINELIIKATDGKFFSINYVNNKGEKNSYVVRTGVKKGLKGTGRPCPLDAVNLYVISKNGKKDQESIGFRTLYINKISFKKMPKIKPRYANY